MSSENVRAALMKLSRPGGFNALMDRAIIISVDKNLLTCIVQLVSDDAAIIENVKLKAVTNDGDLKQMGLILFPAPGSFVIIGQIDNDNLDLYVLGCTQIESISLDTDTALNLLITADGKLNLNTVLTTFNNGNNGGIPLLNPLTEIINKLQKQVNDLIDAFTTHTHQGVSTGLGVSGVTLTGIPQKTRTLIKTSDIENKTILQ